MYHFCVYICPINNEQHLSQMNTTKPTYTIYTNGVALFTLEDYSPAAGVCLTNGITLHKQMTHREMTRMHKAGSLHYIYGIGDSAALKGGLKRGRTYGAFTVR